MNHPDAKRTPSPLSLCAAEELECRHWQNVHMEDGMSVHRSLLFSPIETEGDEIGWVRGSQVTIGPFYSNEALV